VLADRKPTILLGNPDVFRRFQEKPGHAPGFFVFNFTVDNE